MVASDGDLARRALETLDELGVRATVMETADALRQDRLGSDVDVIVDRPGPEVVRLLARALPDLRLLILCRYDVGGYALFAADAGGSRALQLDLLHDPRGRGRLGLRTAGFSDAPGVRGESDLAPEQRAVYYLVKGAWKGQRTRVREAREILLSLPEPERSEVFSRFVTPRMTRPVLRLLDASCEPHLPRRPTVEQLARVADRVVHPAGVRLRCSEESLTAWAAALTPLVSGVKVTDGHFAAARAWVLVRRPEVILCPTKSRAPRARQDDRLLEDGGCTVSSAVAVLDYESRSRLGR